MIDYIVAKIDHVFFSSNKENKGEGLFVLESLTVLVPLHENITPFMKYCNDNNITITMTMTVMMATMTTKTSTMMMIMMMSKTMMLMMMMMMIYRQR